jgi:hypothetical protein
MLCPHCGSDISDDSRICPRCRATLAIEGPVLASTDVSRQIPKQEQQVRRLFAVIFLAASCGIAAWVLAHRSPVRRMDQKAIPVQGVPILQKITQATFTVDSGAYQTYKVSVGPNCQSPRIEGNVQLVSASTRERIEVLVLDSTNFELWKKRRPTTVLYRAASNRSLVNVTLPSNLGQYYVIFRNQQSATPVLLQADLSLACVRRD